MIRHLLIPLLLTLLFAGGAALLLAQKVETQRRSPPRAVFTVETQSIEPGSQRVLLESHGSVRPQQRSRVSAEVSGRVLFVAESVRVGRSVAEGEELLRVDTTDLKAALREAEAALAGVQLEREEEKAQQERALAKWRRYNDKDEPSPLLARRPQFKRIEARHRAAHAQVQKARKDLELATVVAPYAGIIEERLVDIGEFVLRGSPLFTIQGTERVEIRAPFTREQWPHLKLGAKARAKSNGTTYEGTLDRLEGSIDPTTRQHFGYITLQGTYEKEKPLRVGQFTTVEIQGPLLENVLLLPRSTVQRERFIWAVDASSNLVRRELDILWKSDEHIIASPTSLGAGESLVSTPLGSVKEGTPVEVLSQGEKENVE